MNKLKFTLGVCLVIGCQNSLSVELAVNDGLLISEATILSPESDEYLQVGYVVTDGEKLVYVGLEKPDIQGTYQILNARDKFLIPGLIDSHVHVSSTPAISDGAAKQPKLVEEYLNQLPKSFLYYGFTTVVDLGTSSLQYIDRFKSQPLHPDIYYAGNGAVIGQGYGVTNWNETPSNFVAVKDSSKNPNIPFDPEQHTPQAVVKRIADSGAIVLKSYHEPGWAQGSDLPVPSQEMIEELKQAAHDHNMVFAVHANNAVSHRAVAEAGIDIVAHGLWNWGGLSPQNDVPPAAIRDILDIHIKKGIAYTPTSRVMYGLQAMADEKFLNDPELANVLPASVLEYYRAEKDRIYRDEFGDEPKASSYFGIGYGIARALSALKYMADHGGNIIFGTDTPSAPTFGNPPGYNGYLELVSMREAGLSLDAILDIATLNTAKAYHLSNLYGTIEPGKYANLVLLNENPLENIVAYNTIDTVIIRGKAVDRNKLKAD